MKQLSFILFVLSILLLGCGTLEVERAPAGDDAPTMATSTPAPAPHVALTGYSDPVRGFTLPVPQDAVVDETDDEDGYLIGFARPEEGFTLLLRFHSELPAEVTDAPALLRHAFTVDNLPEPVTPVAAGPLDAVQIAVPPEAGQNCAEVEPVAAAYVAGRRGFSLIIRSDSPGRCAAAELPETAAILAGFRFDPAVAARMTPTPVPPPPVQVAYLREGNVWLWTEREGRLTLTEDLDAEGPLRLHPEGKWVAYLRDGHLWAVERRGDDELALTDDSTFTAYRMPDGAPIEPLGFRPYQFAWVPGSDLLLFNTRLLLEGPGLLLADDLWQVNVATGQVSNLLRPGEGGSFTISPDGSRLALVRPDVVESANADGSERRQLLSYEPVLTYSEYQFYAQPVWSPDGSVLRVAVPPADPLGDPGAGTEIWHLPAAEGPARLLGTIPAAPVPPGANIAIGPDLGTVAFLQDAEPGSGKRDLLLAPLGEGVGEPAVYAEGVDAVEGWAPNGESFLFVPAFDGTTRLLRGRPGGEPEPVGDPASAVTGGQWAGPEGDALVYLQHAGSGWEIWLDPSGEEARMLAEVPGTPPALDTR